MKFRKVLHVEYESSYPYWIDYSTVVLGEVEKVSSVTLAEFIEDDDFDIGEDCESTCYEGRWFVVRTSRMDREVLYLLED